MGDERPSMMERSRSSTLIKPSELGLGLTPTQSNSRLVRGNSRGKPLINLEDDDRVDEFGLRHTRAVQSNSVFGIDTLWEQEMKRLREIEATEAENEARIATTSVQLSKQDKARNGPPDIGAEEFPFQSQLSPEVTRVADKPPTIPAIELRPRGTKPQVASEDGSDESDRDSFEPPKNQPPPKWFAGDSDEEGNKNSTTKPGRVKMLDDEDDRPLLAHVVRARADPTLRPQRKDSDSDSDKPLSTVLQGYKVKSSRGAERFADDTDDDKPLGVLLHDQRTTNATKPKQVEACGPDEDNVPLGLQKAMNRGSALTMGIPMGVFPDFAGRGSFMLPTPSLMSGAMPAFHQSFNQTQMMPPAAAVQGTGTAKFGRVDAWRRAVE
jgi:hypothetical protein